MITAFMMDKRCLLDSVKKESKMLMEEAVTKKFIHFDSCSVTSLCGAVDNCITHCLKKRIGGLLPPHNDSMDVLMKLAKVCCAAETVLCLSKRLLHIHQSKGRFWPDALKSPEKQKLIGYSGFSTKYLWIRIALLEKLLAKIINSLLENAKDFYEPGALLMDPVNGASLVWLLDGPSSLDYSKMKTPDGIWNDPTAYELVQRHRIYSSPNMSHNLKPLTNRRQRLFTMCSVNARPTISGVPSLAREHVDSLHQNADTTLLYGKNNVTVTMSDVSAPLQGYLSLHKSCDGLFLKWAPNPMLQTSEMPVMGEKSKYWDQAVTVNLSDMVYLHCHHTGGKGDSIVLISQDGVQLPPLVFQSGGSLTAFLTCLDQGLYPHGRLDPPLLSRHRKSDSWPKLRHSILPEKLLATFQDKGEARGEDYVFRLLFTPPTNQIAKSDFKRLLSTSSLPKKLSHLDKSVHKKSFLPKLHSNLSVNKGDYAGVSRLALNLACEKMKHRILSRAFSGWVASYRHIKTVRTHLASLVLPWCGDKLLPSHVEKGLTEEIWEGMKNKGLKTLEFTLAQYVYHGGIADNIRKEVWPYLLGHYSFTLPTEKFARYNQTSTENYKSVLDECKAVEKQLQEREKDLLALNGFGNGDSTFYHTETSDGSNSLDDNVNDNTSLDASLTDPIETTHLNGHTPDGKCENKEFSVIHNILETKKSLKEMVERASKQGLKTWKKVIKKEAHKASMEKINEFDGLHQQFVPHAGKNFDIELECDVCGKQIIESRSNFSTNSTNAVDEISNVTCYACREEVAPANKNYPSVIYNQSRCNGKDVVVINGSDTPLTKQVSVSSATSSYSEDYLKDFALNIHRIDKDVLRCDRTNPYFTEEKNLEKLRNVMLSYVWERLSVGYIQGMCDLCAPLLVVMDDEALVYSCFVKLMERMENNFPHGDAMDLHLSNLASLIQIMDPELHEIFDVDGDTTIFYFAYRWFLLDFKRELVYEDVFRVWETIWSATSISSEHFNLFVALAIIELYREIVIDNKMDFTDIIKFFNEMAEQHDAVAVLNLARNIVRKLQDLMHPGDAPMHSGTA